jgi:hypothetical protein
MALEHWCPTCGHAPHVVPCAIVLNGNTSNERGCGCDADIQTKLTEALRLLDLAQTRFLALSMVSPTCDIPRIKAFADSVLVEIGAPGWTREAMETGVPSSSPESARAYLDSLRHLGADTKLVKTGP